MTKKKQTIEKREQKIVANDARLMLAEEQDLREQKQITDYEPTQIRSVGHATTNEIIGGEVGLADHPTHQTSSFFPSCTGFEVSGSHFNTYSIGNVFINVTHSSNDERVQVHGSAPDLSRNRQREGSLLPRPSYSRLSLSPSPDHITTSPNYAIHTQLDSAIKFYNSAELGKPTPTSPTQKDQNHRQILELFNQFGNNICADCKARVSRWASDNLGIFICVNCASKVKSLTMDDWTKDQIQFMESMGNNKSNALYNPNELRTPPPPDIENDGRDGEMEQYIRSKYEYKRFMDKSAPVGSKLGSPRLAALVTPTSTPWPSPATTKHPRFFASSLPSTSTYPIPPRQPWSIPPNNPSGFLTVQQQQELNSRNDIQSVLATLDEMIGPDKPSKYKPPQPHVNGAIGAQGYPVGVTSASTGIKPFASHKLSVDPYSQQASQSPFAPAPYIPQTQTQSHPPANIRSYASAQSFGLPNQMSSTTSGFSQPIQLPQSSMQTQSSSFIPTGRY